jgi:hypothetical protein
LPLGAVTIVGIAFFFQNPDRAAVADLGWAARIKEFDLEGTAAFIPAIICLLLALQWGGTQYAWGSWRIILLFVLFGVLIIGFIGIQAWKKDRATVPPRVISKRSVWSAAWYAFCLGAAFMLLVFYLPIWFQAVKGASAVKSGIMNLPLILGLVIVSIISGIAVTLIGYYAPLMIASSIIMAIGAGLLTTLEPSSGHAKWIGYQALTGIGIGLGMQQPLIAVQTVLDLVDVPTATSIIVFAQTLVSTILPSLSSTTQLTRITGRCSLRLHRPKRLRQQACLRSRTLRTFNRSIRHPPHRRNIHSRHSRRKSSARSHTGLQRCVDAVIPRRSCHVCRHYCWKWCYRVEER